MDTGLRLTDGSVLCKQTYEELLRVAGSEFSVCHKISEHHLNVSMKNWCFPNMLRDLRFIYKAMILLNLDKLLKSLANSFVKLLYAQLLNFGGV